MNDLGLGLVCFLLGAFLVSNVSFLRKLLSFDEFFFGLMKGMNIGEQWRKGKGRRKK